MLQLSVVEIAFEGKIAKAAPSAHCEGLLDAEDDQATEEHRYDTYFGQIVQAEIAALDVLT